jgi:hypothetical protein
VSFLPLLEDSFPIVSSVSLYDIAILFYYNLCKLSLRDTMNTRLNILTNIQQTEKNTLTRKRREWDWNESWCKSNREEETTWFKNHFSF